MLKPVQVSDKFIWTLSLGAVFVSSLQFFFLLRAIFVLFSTFSL